MINLIDVKVQQFTFSGYPIPEWRPRILLDLKREECELIQQKYDDIDLKKVGWEFINCGGPYNLGTTTHLSKYDVTVAHDVRDNPPFTLFEFSKSGTRSPEIKFMSGDEVTCRLERKESKFEVSCGNRIV